MDDASKELFTGNKDNDPWLSPATIAKELTIRHAPLDYSLIVGGNKVLFLAENHRNRAIREHLARNAKRLKESGITHYAIEAIEQGNAIFERLNRGEQVDLSQVDVGPGRRDYEEVIRAMIAQGIKVVAIDIDQSKKPTKEEREARITQNLTRILDEDLEAKIAVLIGGFHTTRHYISEGVASVGRRMMEAQVPAVNVHFTGGQDAGPRMITDGARSAGIAGQEFMLDFRPYKGSKYVPYGAGEADFVIHLPQQVSASSSFGSLGRFP